MNIYQHRDSVTTASGSTSTSTLDVRGGLCRQMYIKANTATTVFKVNVVDENSLTVMDYGFHTGQLNDTGLNIPVKGKYTINVTNASPDDTFSLYMGVQE